MKNDTHAKDGETCGQSTDSADNLRTRVCIHCNRDNLPDWGCGVSPWFCQECIRAICKPEPYKPSDKGRIRLISYTNPETGEVTDLSGSIETILATPPGERLPAPTFGTDIATISAPIAPASYGEPWGRDDISGGIKTADGEWVLGEDHRARAVQCVNACQGITEPAEALREARKILDDGELGHSIAATVKRTLGDKWPSNDEAGFSLFHDIAEKVDSSISSALAKLTPA